MVDFYTVQQARNRVCRIATAYIFAVAVGMRQRDLRFFRVDNIACHTKNVHSCHSIAVDLNRGTGFGIVIINEQHQKIGTSIIVVGFLTEITGIFIETQNQEGFNVLFGNIDLALIFDGTVANLVFGEFSACFIPML